MKGVTVVLAHPIPVEIESGLINRVVATLNHQLSPASGQINLKLVDEAEITTLNEEYGGPSHPTDVLSFSYLEGDLPAVDEIGDVAVNYQLAAIQAAAAGTSLSQEVAILTLHGILHILGYDHQTFQEQTQMNQLQRQIMTDSGLSYEDFKWE